MKRYEGHVRGIRGGLKLTGEGDAIALAIVSEPAACNDNTGGRTGSAGRAAVAEASDAEKHDILHLAELVPVVRQRLGVADSFEDSLILASLRAIAAETGDRARWRVAFQSRLGLWLSQQGRELGQALTTLVALVPPPRS